MDPNNPVQTETPPLPIPPTPTPTPSPTPVLCDYSVQSGDVSYLAQSIEEANTTPESSENICLAMEGYYNVESPDMSGYALPAITSEIVIFGNGSTLARDGETTQEFGILRVENSGTLYLSNLTIRNGYNSGGSEPSGGAISNAGIVVVTSSTLENNTAVDYGGAIFNTGTLSLIDSTMTGNTAINYGGGGIRSTDGSVDIINSVISGNSAGWGGGIDSFLATVDISGSTISDNQGDIGGGIFNLEGQLTITDSVLSGNRAFVSGGAALDSDGDTALSGSCIYDNAVSTGIAVANQGEESLAAENNFWGASDGPSGSGLGGSGDAIGGDVDAEPFLSSPPNPCATYVPGPTDTPAPTDTTTPTPTPTFTDTPTETPTSTVTPTFTPTATPTETPTATSTPTATFTPSHTPTPTMTPTPMPQEGWLTFVSKRPAEGSGGIAVWNVFAGLESGGLVQLTDNASTSVRYLHPVWSPDHQRIAFAREIGDAFDLCMLVVATRAYTCDLTVNAAGGNQRTPAWSPGGDWLAYASDHDGDEDIYRVAIVNGLPSGTAYNLTTRATNDGNDSDPDWHGDWIVYQTDRDGNLEIFAMFADADAYDAVNDGRRRTRITDTAVGIVNFQPAWSPNGNRIAYTSNVSGKDDILLLEAPPPANPDGSWTVNFLRNVTSGRVGDWRFTAWKKNDATQNVIAVIRDLSVKQLVIVTLSNPLTVTTPPWSISGIAHDDPDW